MVDLPSRPLAEIDPEFERVALETGQLTYILPGLSVREKLMLCLANDLCRGHVGLALQLHVQAALSNGVSIADIFALVRFMAPYGGYPASADLLANVGAIGAQLGLDLEAVPLTQAPAKWMTKRSPYPPTTSTRTSGLHGSSPPGPPERGARPGLAPGSVRSSPLTADVSNGTFGESFRHHVELALDGGAAPEQLRDVVRFCSEFGFVKAVAAFRALDALLVTESAVKR